MSHNKHILGIGKYMPKDIVFSSNNNMLETI